MNAATKWSTGLVVELAGRGHLQHAPVVQHGDPVGHRHRLLLIVRHDDERHADLVLETLELDLHLSPELAVERCERLVQQQDPRALHDRAGQRDSLALPAGELMRPAVCLRDKVHLGEHLLDP